MYSEKAIEKISIQEITNKAGYNRSTFYQYFSDIYELLEYVENDVLHYIHENIDATSSDPSDIVQLLDKKGDYLKALLGDYGSIRFVEKLKVEVIFDDQKCIIPDDNPIAPYLLEFHMSTSLSLFRLWQRRENDLTAEELFELIDALFKKGIGSVQVGE